MRYIALVVTLMISTPAMAQAWFDGMLGDLSACQMQAWRDCPDALACLETRAIAKAICRATCEHDLALRATTPLTRSLRADELACMTDSQDLGLICDGTAAWRQSEIAARIDAFDYALNEYPYLTRLTASEIVDRVYRIAQMGFNARGGCVTTNHGRSVTLLLATALAINRVRTTGEGAHRWMEAQALAIEWLRSRRGY